MDKILMNNMIFYGFHGVLPEEKKVKQKFIINIELYLNLEKACKSDDVIDTVSYADVFSDVKVIVEDNKFDLIEHLAYEISKKILKNHDKVMEVMVQVLKPNAPVDGKFDNFGVEIWRKK